jgi:hypothetical protein
MAKCTQRNCTRLGTHRVTWPGNDESIVCGEHRETMAGAAEAMGFHLQFIPLTMIAAAPPGSGPCARCAGCGKIANSDQGEPWSDWERLPPGSDLAVRMGVIEPLRCPSCEGSGVEPVKAAAPPQVDRWASHAMCGTCWGKLRRGIPVPYPKLQVESFVCCYCGKSSTGSVYVRDQKPSFCQCAPEEE